MVRMKYFAALTILALITISACSFTPVLPQAQWEAYATARAMPIPPLPTMDNPTVPPTATEALVPTVTPEPTACEPLIKGNIAADGTKIAHSPGQANYNNVVIDESKGERMFCTIEDAIAAGWRAAKN